MNPGPVEDYVVRALVDLMLHPDAPIREIAARTAIPAAHLVKVIQALARAGLVETTRGRGGGVRLAYPPGEISLRHAVEAVQGPLRFWRCPRRGSGCPRDPNCPICRFWIDLEAATTARLEHLRLADLRYDCPGGLATGQD